LEQHGFSEGDLVKKLPIFLCGLKGREIGEEKLDLFIEKVIEGMIIERERYGNGNKKL